MEISKSVHEVLYIKSWNVVCCLCVIDVLLKKSTLATTFAKFCYRYSGS